MKKFLSVVCLAALFVGCGSEANADSCPDIEIQIGSGPKYCFNGGRNQTHCVIIQSKEDDLQINNLIINRGNCNYAKYREPSGYTHFVSGTKTDEEKLRQEGVTKEMLLDFFGEPWNFGRRDWVGMNCNWQSVLEVTVETNKGTCTYKFNQ
nr:hypothetical protein [uncultured Campylobacter sp.]